MMIMMGREATAEQVTHVVRRLEDTGTVHAKVVPGELQIAIAALGDAAAVRGLGIEALPGVDRVVPLSRPYKLASSELTGAASVFDIAGRRIGPDTFCVIAGPCTVESREQTLAVAGAVAPHACMLRGGAFKPRTSPFAFKDLQHADAVADVADVIQVGARNMQNYALLEVVGRLGKPVLLKRGLSCTLEELLMAADYVLKEGSEQVVLCERGIRTFETATRFTLDLGAIPWLKLHTHLPVIVDPSPAAGDRRLVEALARGAAAVGADGIIVEVHADPEQALCDGPQQLHAGDFPAFAQGVLAHAALAGRGPTSP
jgi:3-deoxy-7-phosphoheptulonate synthase